MFSHRDARYWKQKGTFVQFNELQQGAKYDILVAEMGRRGCCGRLRGHSGKFLVSIRQQPSAYPTLENVNVPNISTSTLSH